MDCDYLTGSRAPKKARKASLTELQDYYSATYRDIEQDSNLVDVNPLDWWIKVGKQSYPILFKIAVDFLPIPSTSCECERAFSTAKRTITVDRNALSTSSIEALQLQKNWLRNKAVRSKLSELSAHIQRKQIAERVNEVVKEVRNTLELPSTPIV